MDCKCGAPIQLGEATCPQCLDAKLKDIQDAACSFCGKSTLDDERFELILAVEDMEIELERARDTKDPDPEKVAAAEDELALRVQKLEAHELSR